MTQLPDPAQALTIQPGDVLILRFDIWLADTQRDRIIADAMAAIPGLAGVHVIHGCQQTLVYRPDTAPPTREDQAQ